MFARALNAVLAGGGLQMACIEGGELGLHALQHGGGVFGQELRPFNSSSALRVSFLTLAQCPI
jgi:hypothetical protein